MQCCNLFVIRILTLAGNPRAAFPLNLAGGFRPEGGGFQPGTPETVWKPPNPLGGVLRQSGMRRERPR
jgi:hypothetical protein